MKLVPECLVDIFNTKSVKVPGMLENVTEAALVVNVLLVISSIEDGILIPHKIP
jgi:hypothetical protein